MAWSQLSRVGVTTAAACSTSLQNPLGLNPHAAIHITQITHITHITSIARGTQTRNGRV